MTSSLIKDTFTYFAKFPVLEGVLKSFNKGTSEYNTDEYAAFKTEIENLQVKNLVPELTDYVFGVNEDVVKKRVNEINGLFLFVDYGNIYDEKLQPMQTEKAEFLLAVSVGRKTDPKQFDIADSVIHADKTLEIITTIKDIMWDDSKQNRFTKDMTFPVEITPWFMRELHNVDGWTMLFKKTGVHLV